MFNVTSFLHSKYFIRLSYSIEKLKKNRTIRYFYIGFLNTLFGYSVGLAFYLKMNGSMSLPLILVFINIISISFSFITYKIFVFKTKGNWIAEYFKSFIVYGFSAIFSVILTIVMVDFFTIKFWIAQAITILIAIGITFALHKNFTYKV